MANKAAAATLRQSNSSSSRQINHSPSTNAGAVRATERAMMRRSNAKRGRPGDTERLARPVLSIRTDSQFFHASVQRAAGQPEGCCSLHNTAGMSLQSRTNQNPFGVFEIHVLQCGRGWVARRQSQVGHTHHLARRQERRSLDDITELADVTRPCV